MRVGTGAFSFRTRHAFWIAIGVLAIVSATAILSTSRLIEQYSASLRSHQTVLELTDLLSDLKDVETSARGYAITREPGFIRSYKVASAAVGARLARLRQLGQSEAGLRAGIGGLDPLASQRLAAADTLVQLAANGAPHDELASAVVSGRSEMDAVRQRVRTLVALEQRAGATRAAKLERQAVSATIALALGVLLSGLVLVWLFNLLRHEIERREEAELELRNLNTELEDRVHDRTAQVKQTRDLLDAVVENLPDMVLLKKRDGDSFRYLLINSAGERVLGRDRSEILGRTAPELFPAEEAKEVIAANEAVELSGAPRTFTDRKLTTAAGERTVETRMVPIAEKDGAPSLILAIIRDVTEQRALQTQVREMQRLESIGRLTGGIAHDFNNLLAVIMGSVELVCEKLPKGSDSAQIAEEALDAVRRGAELVRRLLAFARKQHLEPTAVNMNDRLPGVVPMLERSLGEKIRVQVKPAQRLWSARIDPTQVDDALVNLAINARDAMPDGGTLTIETENVVLDRDYAAQHVEVTPGKYVMLAVSDTGSGMAPDVLSRAFEPFFTTKGEGEGTGLGLSQVFGWVKQSGGHIKIYSEVGHGTTVKLYLPRAGDKEPEGVDEGAALQPDGRGDETILLVEDNPHVRRTASRQLADLGYRVVEADHADAALEQIRSGLEFELLLTDVVMPGGMSGYDLAAAAQELRPGTKVLFTSGYTELAANGLRRSGKGPLISKPYSKSDLGRAIRSVLDRRARSTA
jgi:PAS domain S-box-containing protein